MKRLGFFLTWPVMKEYYFLLAGDATKIKCSVDPDVSVKNRPLHGLTIADTDDLTPCPQYGVQLIEMLTDAYKNGLISENVELVLVSLVSHGTKLPPQFAACNSSSV
jgi:hypothetical protein